VGRCGTGRSFRSRYDLAVVGHEIDLAPGIETVGVTSVAGFRWTRSPLTESSSSGHGVESYTDSQRWKALQARGTFSLGLIQ
jgi:hypothetical protein